MQIRSDLNSKEKINAILSSDESISLLSYKNPVISMKSLVRFTGAVSTQFIDEGKQTEEDKTNI